MKTSFTLLATLLFIQFQLSAQEIEKKIVQRTYSTNFDEFIEADLNNDGIDDYIGQNGTIIWFEGTASYTLGSMHVVIAETANDMAKIEAVDINNDGYLDIVYNNSLTDFNMEWIANPGPGTDEWEKFTIPGTYNRRIGFFDVDADDDVDFVYEDYSSYLGYRENIGGVFNVTHTIPDTYSTLSSSRAADIDQDGDTDWVGYFNDCCTKYFKNNGNGTFTASTASSDEYNSWITTVDVSSDGYADVVYYYNDDLEVSVFNPVTNTFGPALYFGDIDDLVKMINQDIDSDGDLDILLLHYIEYGGLHLTLSWIENTGVAMTIDDMVPLLFSVEENMNFYHFFDFNKSYLISNN